SKTEAVRSQAVGCIAWLRLSRTASCAFVLFCELSSRNPPAVGLLHRDYDHGSVEHRNLFSVLHELRVKKDDNNIRPDALHLDVTRGDGRLLTRRRVNLLKSFDHIGVTYDPRLGYRHPDGIRREKPIKRFYVVRI